MNAPTGLGDPTITHATTLRAGYIPPAVTADTTPPIEGVEIPVPPGVLPGTTSGVTPDPATVAATGLTPQFPLTTTPPVAAPVVDPALPIQAAPVPAPTPTAMASVPTWAWVLGGVALLGIIGAVIWAATRETGAGAAATSRPNPLPLRGGSRRRRVKRRHQTSRRRGR
jgi:hypothetical protein